MFNNCKIVGENVSTEVYMRQTARRGEKDYSMSRSALVDFAVNPAKWLAGGTYDEPTKATDWGSVMDCLLTCPDKFNSLFAITPEVYPAKGAKKGGVDVEKPWNRNATYCR